MVTDGAAHYLRERLEKKLGTNEGQFVIIIHNFSHTIDAQQNCTLCMCYIWHIWLYVKYIPTVCNLKRNWVSEIYFDPKISYEIKVTENPT